MAREAEAEDVGMEGLAEGVVAEVGGGLDEGRECVLVGGDGA